MKPPVKRHSLISLTPKYLIVNFIFCKQGLTHRSSASLSSLVFRPSVEKESQSLT